MNKREFLQKTGIGAIAASFLGAFAPKVEAKTTIKKSTDTESHFWSQELPNSFKNRIAKLRGKCPNYYAIKNTLQEFVDETNKHSFDREYLIVRGSKSFNIGTKEHTIKIYIDAEGHRGKYNHGFEITVFQNHENAIGEIESYLLDFEAANERKKQPHKIIAINYVKKSFNSIKELEDLLIAVLEHYPQSFGGKIS